jgi:uncharacterized low-complexity protein
MKKTFKTPLALAMGMTLPMAANAADSLANPFALTDLSSGYTHVAAAPAEVTDKIKAGACGEGKCGAGMKKDAAAASSADKKAIESKCAANKSATPASGSANTSGSSGTTTAPNN